MILTYLLTFTCTVAVSEVHVATLEYDGSWRRVASSEDNYSPASAATESVILRRGSLSGVACIAVGDGACDAASLRSLRPVVQHVATESRFVRQVETVLKARRDGVSDLPACKTTAISWYRTTSAPTVLSGRMLNCVTENQLSASARLFVECKTRFIIPNNSCSRNN